MDAGGFWSCVVEASPIAFAVADHFCALLSSDAVKQRTFGMQATEFRDFLAESLAPLLERSLAIHSARAIAPPPLPDPLRPREPDDHSYITDDAARSLLENAPSEVRGLYGKQIRNGRKPPEALDDALTALKRRQEVAS